MTHDPLCDWLQTICTAETCSGARLGDPCEHQWCQCELIAKVRGEERWATVESAVYVASQFGAVPELVQLLSRLYEAPEVQIDDEVRREAARELTRMAQEMGMIP